MDQVGIRELRGNVAAIVRRAGAGDVAIITVDGKPVAQLGPLTPGPAGITLDLLAAAGLVLAPRRPDRPPEPPPATDPPVDARLDRVIEELRGR